MTHPLARVRNGFLEDPGRDETHAGVPVGSTEWYSWLTQHRSFRFEHPRTPYTARREQRPGGWYWYASRRTEGTLHTLYLGRTSALTLARLEEIAAQFTAPSVFPPEQEGPTHLASPQTTTVPHDAGASTLPPDRAPADRGAPAALAGAGHDLRFATKLAVPRLRSKLVHRARLLTHLDQGMQARLILVSAPAGSGKTTLLTQWLAESKMAAAWLSLEPADNEPVRFLSALIAALQQLHPQIGTTALALLHTPPPSPPPTPELVLEQLVPDLFQHLPKDVAFILDDYHVITADALHRAMASLVEHAPPQLHLVIATRTDPALPLARLRARGELCEVRAAQLQFLPEETSTFLHAVMGLDLSPEEGAVLQERTEGWIAGLQ
ncbi:MAG TPA: AAA family ATPase, partial [Ktedonobacteraceae bacterium]|nr:AAA family ATPase [Ktedonobacteraceae bacterium]